MNPEQLPTVTVADIPAGAALLDVREDVEWRAGHIDGAKHIPMNEVPGRVGELPSDERLVVLCKVGGRSAQVTTWLLANGYDAVNLEGGMLAWDAAGKPMVAETAQPPHVA